MKLKKLKSHKLTFAFIAVMVFFTFFSKSFHYLMMPKVIAEPVISGVLSERKILEPVNFYFNHQQDILINNNLPLPLYILKYHVSNGEHVTKDSPIITLKNDAYEQVYDTLYDQLTREKANYAQQLNGYRKELDQLEQQLNHNQKLILSLEKDSPYLISSLEPSYKEIIRLEKEIQHTEQSLENFKILYNLGSISKNTLSTEEIILKDLQDTLAYHKSKYSTLKAEEMTKLINEQNIIIHELAYLKENKIYNGHNINIQEDKIKDLEFQLNNAKDYMNGYDILANTNGIFYVNENHINDFTYTGTYPLGCIVLEDEELLLRVPYPSDVSEISLGHKVIIKTTSRNYNGEIIDHTVLDGQPYLIIKPKTSSSNCLDLENMKITLTTTTPYYDTLVPASAVITENFNDSYVYILNEKESILGTQYYIEQAKITVGKSNAKYINVLSGLSPHDKVITNWDRPLKDGEEVKFPLKKEVR